MDSFGTLYAFLDEYRGTFMLYQIFSYMKYGVWSEISPNIIPALIWRADEDNLHNILSIRVIPLQLLTKVGNVILGKKLSKHSVEMQLRIYLQKLYVIYSHRKSRLRSLMLLRPLGMGSNSLTKPLTSPQLYECCYFEEGYISIFPTIILFSNSLDWCLYVGLIYLGFEWYSICIINIHVSNYIVMRAIRGIHTERIISV